MLSTLAQSLENNKISYKNLFFLKISYNLAEVLIFTIQKNTKTMKELVDQIKAEYDLFVKNAEAQVEKGNKAAGARARKAALNLMKAMKEFRKVSVDATK